MKIPKHLALPGMPAEQKKRVVAFVKECRKALSKAPAFDTTEEAVDEAVKQAKKEDVKLVISQDILQFFLR